VFFPPVIRLMGLQDRLDDPAALAAREACALFYAGMEGELDKGEYLAGAYSFADIAFYMAQVFAARMGAPMTEATPKLLSWRARMTERPAVREVVGTMAQFLKSHQRPLPGFMAGLAG